MNCNKSIKKNLGLQTAYQILNVILPLITAPYLARVLGAEQLGVFSYTSSIVSYFVLFAMLGTINYGTRCIAAVRDDRVLTSNVFCSVFSLQIIFSMIALIGYVFYYAFLANDNQEIVLIQGIAVLSCFFDINWLYFGVENFRLTVVRSIIIRFITVVVIFVFVKQESDLWLYALFMLSGTFVSQLVLWFRVKKIVDFCIPNINDVVMHLKPNIVLFIPLLAMSVYHAMDKTMLGFLSTYTQSGLYYNSDKVVNIPLCILTGFGTVMLPRMTSIFQNEKKEKGNDLFVSALDGVLVLSMAMCFGISAISKDFIPFFFGVGYEECINLTIVLSIVIIIKGVSNTIRTLYLIPLKMDKLFIYSVLAGAVVNIVANLLLIPRYGAMGAVLGTVVAEFVACVWQLIHISKNFSFIRLYLNSFVYVIIGIGMFVFVRNLSDLPIPMLGKLTIEIFAGACFFAVVTMLFWFISNNAFWRLLKKK